MNGKRYGFRISIQRDSLWIGLWLHLYHKKYSQCSQKGDRSPSLASVIIFGTMYVNEPLKPFETLTGNRGRNREFNSGCVKNITGYSY